MAQGAAMSGAELAGRAAADAVARYGLQVLDGPDDPEAHQDFEEVTFPLAVHLVYRADGGQVSARAVTLRKIWRRSAVLYIRGRCHVRNADRTFRADRIATLTCLATGEVPDDPLAWLLDNATTPSLRADPTAAAIRGCADELEVLAYLARVDDLHPAEVAAIVDYVEARHGEACDREALGRYVRKLTPTYYGLTPIVRRLATDPERWAALRACVMAVLKADGDVTEEELDAWRDLTDVAASSPPAAAEAFARATAERIGARLSAKIVWADGAFAAP